MKRLTALALSLMLFLTLMIPAAQAEEVTPTPPEWVKAEDYITFPGDEVYQKENWDEILRLRRSAARGDPMPADQMQMPDDTASVGTCFELGLIRLRYAANGRDPEAFSYSAYAFSSASSRYSKSTNYHFDQKNALMGLWTSRCQVIYMPENHQWGRNIANQLKWLEQPAQDFFDFEFADRIPADTHAVVEQQVRAAFHPVAVYLDDVQVEFSDIQPEVVEGRTMVSAFRMAQCLGADVFYEEKTGEVTMKRARHTVVLTTGQATAYLDGQAVEMNTAPYSIGGYVAEQLLASVS